MKTEGYTIESLKKKKIAELQEIATGLSISFKEDDTKKVLAEAILAEEAKIAKEASKESSSNKAPKAPAQKTVVYTLPKESKGVIDIDGKKYSREEALKNQALLAKLKNLGHKAIIVKK